MRLFPAFLPLAAAALVFGPVPSPVPLHAQTAAAPQGAGAAAASNRMLGTVTASTPATLTIKAESGGETTVSVDAQTRVLRANPGAKSLAGADTIQLTDLAPGDRVLVVTRPSPADPNQMRASTVVAMKSADIAETHAKESQAWQQRGLSGVVRSLSPAGSGSAGTVVLATGQPGRTLTLAVSSSTAIRRYAGDSVSFSNARPATLADIHVGDQLRALPAGEAPAAPAAEQPIPVEQLVAGSFQNIAGTVVNAAAGELTVTNLATKKPVTLRLTGDTQMRKLPPEMAQRLARRTQGGGGAAAAGAEGGSTAMAGSAPAAGAGPGAAGGRPRGGDLNNLLSRAPAVSAGELKKGDAVMIVATEGGGSTPAAAISLLAGVEPLLEAPAASQDVFSASWNLGGNSGGAEAPQ